MKNRFLQIASVAKMALQLVQMLKEKKMFEFVFKTGVFWISFAVDSQFKPQCQLTVNILHLVIYTF